MSTENGLPRLSLRQIEENDLPTLFEHQRDPQAYRMAAFEPRDEAAFFKHWKENVLGDPDAIRRAIVVDQRVAGFVSSFDRDGRREIGYWIGREHWGRGIASEAVRRFIEQDTHRPLYAYVVKTNPASRRVLEKCGFAVVGEASGPPDGRGPKVEDWVLALGEDGGIEPV